MLIIRGKMPTGKGCDGCEFQTSRCEQMDACTCHLFNGVIHNFHNERHKDCPILGEIPDRHGRLIDADRFINKNKDWVGGTMNDMLNELDNAPVVVEATE